MNNGRRHLIATKQEARTLRLSGLTHREIAEKLGASWGSVWLWTKGINLTEKQKKVMRSRRAKVSFTPERRRKLSEIARVRLAPYRTKYTEQDLIQKIINFYKEHQRIPLKREFNMYDEYKRHFGSWNNAIVAAGFVPHQVIFSKKFTAQDGHTCDSFAEKIIDDWLSKNKISHERHIIYRGTKLTADFGIGNMRIEYFGLKGAMPNYDQIIERKREFCRMAGLTLIEVYPNDLFSSNFKHCLGRILYAIREATGQDIG